VDVLGDDSQPRPARLLVHFGQVLLVETDVGLAVGNLEDLDLLESPLDVLLSDAGAPAHVAEGVGLAPVLAEEVDDALRPPGEVGLLAEVGERLLRPADLLLDEAEFVAEGDEELAVALALEEGEDEDAGEVVFGLLDLSGVRYTFEK
jgi:hypothetical protein